MMLSLLNLFFLLDPSVAAEATPGPYVAVRVDYHRAGPEPADGTRPQRLGEQRGSGVIVGQADVDEWLVLTNAHVVEADDGVGKTVPNIYAGGDWRSGRIVSIDSETDLALIRLRFARVLNTVTVSESPPKDGAEVKTNGFVGGRSFCFRTSTLRRALPLDDGAQAWAPNRYFVRTMFNPGESGGAVTLENQLVALIHGNDVAAGWGLVVDHESIQLFLEPFLKKPVSSESLNVVVSDE